MDMEWLINDITKLFKAHDMVEELKTHNIDTRLQQYFSNTEDELFNCVISEGIDKKQLHDRVSKLELEIFRVKSFSKTIAVLDNAVEELRNINGDHKNLIDAVAINLDNFKVETEGNLDLLAAQFLGNTAFDYQ